MTSRWRSRACAVSCVLAISVRSAPVRADGSDAAVATELFNAGRDLMSAGNFAAACPKLAQSAHLDAKVGTLARLAECEEKLGQMVPARAHWQQATNLAQAQRDDRLSHVQAELARVDKRVPKVTVSLTGPVPSGLSLTIDGVDAGAASLDLPLPVEAGRHAIVVSANGKKPYSTFVETRPDGAVTAVEVPPLEEATTFVSLVPAEPAVVSHARTTDEGAPSLFWTPARKVGLAVGSAGAAVLVVGAVFGILAKVEYDDSNADGCTTGTPTCRGTGTSERNTAFSDGTIGTVLLVGGAAVAGAGLTVLLLASPKSEGPLRAAASVGPGSVLIGGSF
jgi:hypothetical protein